MFCTKCGKENGDNVKFCTGCGTPLKVRGNSNEGENRSDGSKYSDTCVSEVVIY